MSQAGLSLRGRIIIIVIAGLVLAGGAAAGLLFAANGPAFVQGPTAPDPLAFRADPVAPPGPGSSGLPAACAQIAGDVIFDVAPENLSAGSAAVQVDVEPGPGTVIHSLAVQVTGTRVLSPAAYEACAAGLPEAATAPAGPQVTLPAATGSVALPLSDSSFSLTVLVPPSPPGEAVAYTWVVTLTADSVIGPLRPQTDAFVTLAPPG